MTVLLESGSGEMCVKITCKISIGQLDWAKNSRSNRSLYWSIELVTNPIGRSKMGYQFDWTGLNKVTNREYLSPNRLRGTHSNRIKVPELGWDFVGSIDKSDAIRVSEKM